jgi:hypothetical protein
MSVSISRTGLAPTLVRFFQFPLVFEKGDQYGGQNTNSQKQLSPDGGKAEIPAFFARLGAGGGEIPVEQNDALE